MTRGRAAAFVVAGLASAALAAVLAGPSMGLFAGSPPAVTGFSGGRFADNGARPNWVSSTAPRADAVHFVAPIAYRGEAREAWAALEAEIAAMPRARVVARAPGYLRAEFASERMGFVDDGEFALDSAAGVIHVKSAARLGIRDFSVNRKRVEAIRAALSRSSGGHSPGAEQGPRS